MKILILCTGNRCRSQMAHGILQQLEPSFKVHSAGVRPASEVHPLAVQVMKEIGIDLSHHYPKQVDRYLNEPWDYVITVCGGARETFRSLAVKSDTDCISALTTPMRSRGHRKKSSPSSEGCVMKSAPALNNWRRLSERKNPDISNTIWLRRNTKRR